MTSITYMGGAIKMGGNKFLLQHGKSRAFWDFGLNFDDIGKHYIYPSTAKLYQALYELMKFGILPGDEYPGFAEKNYRPDYLRAIGRIPSEEADDTPVVLNHAHLDHSGAIHFFRPDKAIYMTRYCKKMLYSIEATGGARYSEFINFKYFKGDTLKPRSSGRKWLQGKEVSIPRNIKVIRPLEPFKVGDIEFTAYPVDHSIEAVAYKAEMGGLKFANTGDFRRQGRRKKDTDYFIDDMAKENLDALLIEGSLIWKESPGTEDDVVFRLIDFIKKIDGLVIVSIAPRDLDRLTSVYMAAQHCKRKLDIDTKMAFRCDLFDDEEIDNYSRDFGFVKTSDKNIGIYMLRKGKGILDSDYSSEDQKKEYFNWERPYIDHRKRITLDEIKRHPSEHLLVMSESNLTGLFDINPPAGSGLVISHAEPYTEEMTLSEKVAINNGKVLHLVMESQDNDLFSLNRKYKLPTAHITGHNGFEDTAYAINKINPRLLIPVHTNRPDLFYKMGFPANRIIIPKQDDVHLFC